MDVRLSEELSHRIRKNKRIENETHGELWVDTGADTCCVGRGFNVLAYTDRYVTLRGYSDRSGEEEKVPIVTAATALDLEDGTTLILVINEALYLGNKQYTSLLNLNQVRYAGHQADDIPLFLSQGSSIHGIKTLDGIHIPFTLKGKSSLMYVRTPTAREMEDCELIEITSEEPWDPSEDDWEENEAKFSRKHRHVRCTIREVNEFNDTDLFISPPYPINDAGVGSITGKTSGEPVMLDSREQVAIDDMLSELPEIRSTRYASRALKSGKRSENIDYGRLRRIFGGVSEDTVIKTLAATTHMVQRSAVMPIHKRFKTKFQQLRYRRLKCTLYSDTFSSNVTSTRGHTKTQGFVCGDAFYVMHYPMKSEKHAAQGLKEFVHTIGIPAQVHTDNAKVETLSEWKDFLASHWIKASVTEPYTAKQNKCEHEFGAVRIHARIVMEQTKCPEQLWDYVIQYVCYVRNRTARKALGDRTPIEVLTGDTPDISELFDFELYEPVSYLNNPDIKFPQAKRKLGRWMGIAESVGQAMCYYILNENGNIITRSTVGKLENSELPAKRREIEELDTSIRRHLEPTEFEDGNNPEVRKMRQHEALKVARRDTTGEKDENGNDDEIVRNRHVIYEINEGDEHNYVSPGQHVDTFFGNMENMGTEQDTDEPSDLTGTEILTSKGGETVRGKVAGRKRDHDGNPMMEESTGEPLYIVEFPDGSLSTEGYNALISALNMQVDANGDEFFTFLEILAHQRRPKGGRGDQKGWFLKILWKSGEITWEPLSSIKEDLPFEAAQYAADNDLLREKAFAKWAPYILRKANRWIRAAKRRKKNNRYKFGIEVPRNVAHALELDRQNGNNLWRDAIAAEMKTLTDMNVFEILERGAKAPKDFKMIPMWIIFDVKMGTFRRKARLVAGGHTTAPPEADTYSSVASKESVRLSFFLAQHNEMDLLSVDITNAYVNAKCREKVATIAGPEFGEYEGYVVIIRKALYGLKSSGAAWHAHLSENLRLMRFIPSRADPDMWMRHATHGDGTEYYEYLVCYVDDLIIVSYKAKEVIQEVRDCGYELKGGDAPETFLGATIGRHTFQDGTSTWYQSAEEYLKNAIKTVESKLGKPLQPGKISTPLEPTYHPEVDITPLLDDDRANYYQSMIGILLWASELGRIDITQEVGLMARFGALPREGHYDAVIRIFCYLKKHLKSRLVYDTEVKDVSDIAFTRCNWDEQYPEAAETLPYDTPKPLGKPVKVTVFCDASHADCLVTRRSTTGILIFVNGTPIRWYSKRQNTVESSTYGSEFVAMRIATEMLLALRTSLRMLGVPLDGPADVFCDNNSVVQSSTIPASVLKKKHNAVSFHKVRETIAAGAMRVSHEPTESNLADLLSKTLSGPRHRLLTNHVLRAKD